MFNQLKNALIIHSSFQFLLKEELKDEHQLQSYFITKIEKYLNGKSHQIIAWDDMF